MKAVLVIDMPSNCSECPCTDYMFCYTTQKELEIDWEVNKPSWCPLKPMPEKIEEGEEPNIKYGISEYAVGRNDVIDEITGETE